MGLSLQILAFTKLSFQYDAQLLTSAFLELTQVSHDHGVRVDVDKPDASGSFAAIVAQPRQTMPSKGPASVIHRVAFRY